MPSPFESIRIGSVDIKNRIAMAPMKTAFGAKDGQVTAQLFVYFHRRAEGGVGLVISEPLYVDKRGQEHPKQLGIDEDDKIRGLRSLAKAIHWGGAKVFAHLNHAGRAANPKAAGMPPEAPSNVPCPRTQIEPVVLVPKRIAEIVSAFALAARRAKVAGFDGVELQFGLGYLVSQFLSPNTNLRTDAYGGNLEGRMRFGREVFSAVREAVGDAYPISVRISASERAPNGLEIEDAIELSRRLERWGANLIHVVTGSTCDSVPWYFQHMALPPAVNETLAAQVKEAVALPVMVAGRLGDPPRMREILGRGMVDMVALGRPLLADPDLPRKMRESRDEEVLLCGHCLQGCLARVMSGQGIGCNFNPEVGHEIEVADFFPQPRRIVVVGGGPAGMQAALSAHRSGHRVTLFERNQLGGQFALAFIPPGKTRIDQPLRSLIGQVERSGIELRLGVEATVGKVTALNPNAVVVATGSQPIIPNIPGLDDPITVEEVLTKRRETGNRVLVLGGGMVGLEIAEFVTRQKGRQCVVVEKLEDVARDMDPVGRKLMMKRLASLPIEILTHTEIIRLDNKHVYVEQLGKQRDLGPFDSVVVTVGNRPLDLLSEKLRDEGFTVDVAGDADRPMRVFDAIASGHRAAITI